MSSPATPAASIPLPVEIILNIVEHLCWQPGDIGRLLRSSKAHLPSFVYLPHPHRFPKLTFSIRQSTISYAPMKPSSPNPSPPISTQPLLYVQSSPQSPQNKNPSSLPHPPLPHPHPRHRHTTPPLRFPHTFPWVSEIHTRHTLLTSLPSSYLLDLTLPSVRHLFETSSSLCKTCHNRGLQNFKTHGLNTLYSLSDSRISGGCIPSSDRAKCGILSVVEADGRAGQEFWVAQQDALELASALAVVWVASMLFDFGPKASWGGENGCEHDGHGADSDAAASGTADYDLVERQCIYRELVLTHGPWFLWASVMGSEEERGMIKGMLDEGMVGLKEYENGEMRKGREGGSLQSVLLRRFCRLSEVPVREGWDEVFDVIEAEVQKYREVHGQ